MSARFEEIDWSPTPIGDISLRRRFDPVTGSDVYEVKLGDDFLMSSLFTVAEVEVARLALAALEGHGFDVVVGGLGLGSRCFGPRCECQHLGLGRLRGELESLHRRRRR